MRISYNWLKWYVPDAPKAEELADILTYHLAEVETVDKLADGDFVLDVKILPNRAHDLLSHQGMAREIASLLNIPFVDPTPKYKIPESKPTELKVEINTDNCRRHVGRIVRNIKVGPSPDWVKNHLESIGQRSINNIVDATNLVMFNCGQPAHAFDMDKVSGLKLVIRDAHNAEQITLLGGNEKVLKDSMMVIADGGDSALDIAGIKGGTNAELTAETKNIILQSDNFEPVSIRKTAQALNIFTDAKKRFENDLSPELGPYAMLELSALIAEMCPEAIFEDVVDVYPKKQEERKLSFSPERISSILGLSVSVQQIEDILNRYNFQYNLTPDPSPFSKNGEGGPRAVGEVFEIIVPPMRLDLVIEEDMAEEIGRVIGYDKLKGEVPKINFKTQANETHAKISWARNKLLEDGYSEVMTYAFADTGKVEVLASASDKKFLRANIADGLKESLKLNKINSPLLGLKEVRIFEIGAVWNPEEEIHVAYNEGDKVIEKNLYEYTG